MSNTLAIATMTGVLNARLTAHLAQAGLNFTVTNSHPGDADAAGVYVHLYSIMPNAALRNESLPERSPSGDIAVRPRLAIDLFYQITFVGTPATYDTERMAGACMTGLHSFPRIAAQEISDFIAAQGGGVLAAADLGDQLEQVRLTPLSADIEDLSRLWGMTQRGFHRLSVLYRASTVMLEPDIAQAPALPVTTPTVTVHTLKQPHIDVVVSSAREQAIVVFGETIVVRGSALRGDPTEIVVGDPDNPSTPDTATDSELRLAFHAGSGLRSGVYPLQVRHRITLENDETRPGPRSNTFPIALTPTLDPAFESATPAPAHADAPVLTIVTVVAEPLPDVSQTLELSLVEVGGDRRLTSTTYEATLNGGGDPAIAFSFPEFAGSYLVRLTVDGATTMLAVDQNTGAFTGPVLNV